MYYLSPNSSLFNKLKVLGMIQSGMIYIATMPNYEKHKSDFRMHNLLAYVPGKESLFSDVYSFPGWIKNTECIL